MYTIGNVQVITHHYMAYCTLCGIDTTFEKIYLLLLLLVYCWVNVVDDGSTQNRHWFNALC